MAPSPIRQLLVWSLPSVAVLLSYLWYRKKRIGAASDTGGSAPIEEPIAASVEDERTRQISEPIDIIDSSIVSELSILGVQREIQIFVI